MKKPNVLKKELVVYCDVDKTLVQKVDSYVHFKEVYSLDHEIEHLSGKYRPLLGNINILKEYNLRGFGIVVWSARGSAWAELWVAKLGLEPYVDQILAKPTHYIDDKHVTSFMRDPIFFNEEDL